MKTAFGDTTLRQHAEHEAEPKTSLPSYPVAVVDEAGELQEEANGRYVTEERPLTVVGYRSAMIVSDDGVSIVDSLPTVLFVLLDGLFESKPLVNIGTGIALICIVLSYLFYH